MQYTINFKRESKYLDEDFVVSKANFNAYYIVKNWPKTWGTHPYSRVFAVLGPSSSGKTHLTHIWQRHSEALFVKPEDGISSLYQKKDCFIIEDIDKFWMEQDLLHIFNLLHEHSKFLMLTFSSSSPPFALPDLLSRLHSVFTVRLEQPDVEMVKIMLMRGFSERSLKVSIEVVNYLALRISREFSVILDVVRLVDLYSLENKRNITIPLIKELLDLIEEQDEH